MIGKIILIAVGICVLIAAVVLIFSSGLFRQSEPPADSSGTASSDSPDSEAEEPAADTRFHISDAQTLYLLFESGELEEYYITNGEEPTVIIDEKITLDKTPVIRGGIILIMEDNVTFADDNVKICITAEGERLISIYGDKPISCFEIDAPESALYMSGSNIPTVREVAEALNVAMYNTLSVSGKANGDTLGGKGRSTVSEVTVYRDKAKTKVWEGMYAQINGNLITVYVPLDAKDKDVEALCLSVTAEGGECDISETMDLTSPKLIDVTDSSGEIRTYRISAERARLGIPILEIRVNDGSDIDSKEEYKAAVMRLDGREYTLRIKGRGNASWRIFPKHSYRIKLDSKAGLCGMTADKDWCLISGYADPSLIRNKVSSEMAQIMTGLPFTPEHEFVDLFVNGEYLGVYLLAEKIEDDEDRVPLGERVTDEDGTIVDMGFLIEFGWDFSGTNVYGRDYFSTTYCKYMYIKEPKITKAYNDEFKYVQNYLKAAESAVIAGEGYEEYIDVDSWVDWFIVNELTNNTECCFYRSLYIYKPVGGKLTAGPIWDYDMAFGNHTGDIYNYNGWASVDFTYYVMFDNWMKFLTKDEKFMSLVRERWAEKKEELMETAFSTIDESARKIEQSQVYNFLKWPKILGHTVGVSRTSPRFATWEEQVDYIKEFLEMRYEWMDKKLSRE